MGEGRSVLQNRLEAAEGLAIPVRVIIGKPEYSKGSDTASGRVWDVVRKTLNPARVQWGWFSSLVGSSSTLARRFRSTYYASFVVTCINAKNAVTFNGASAAFMKLVTEMGPEAHLSAMNFCLVPHWDSQRVCRMISGLFGGNTCPSDVTIEPRAVDYACVDFQAEWTGNERALFSLGGHAFVSVVHLQPLFV